MAKKKQQDIKVFEDFQSAVEKIEKTSADLVKDVDTLETGAEVLLEQSVDLSGYNDKVKDSEGMCELLAKVFHLRLLDVIDALFEKRYSIGFVQRYMEHKYRVSQSLANSLIHIWVQQQDVMGAQDKKLKRVVLEKKLESSMYTAMKRGLLKEELMAMALYAKVAGLNIPVDKETIPDGYKDIKMIIPGVALFGNNAIKEGNDIKDVIDVVGNDKETK